MKRVIFVILLLLTLTGCQVVQAAPPSTGAARMETVETVPVETTQTEPATTEPLPPETEAPTEPPVLADCVEMVLPEGLLLTPDCPEVEVVVSFPQVELPVEARTCALTLELDGEVLKSWQCFRLEHAMERKAKLSASFSLRDPDRTACLKATLCWGDQTLTRETTVWLDNDDPEVYYAKSGEEYPYSIDVLRNQNVVVVYGLEDGEYTFPVKAWLCSTGWATPTGHFRLGYKREWGALFGGVWGQYACVITGNILFHSVPYYHMTKDSLETLQYNRLGSKASAGCVRLPVEGSKWIYDHCATGTTVHIHDVDELPVKRPTAPVLDPDDPRSGWDPTDPDPENPWNQPEETEEPKLPELDQWESELP